MRIFAALLDQVEFTVAAFDPVVADHQAGRAVLQVVAAGGTLMIKQLQFADGPELPAIDFADKYQLHAGERLGDL